MEIMFYLMIEMGLKALIAAIVVGLLEAIKE